MMLNDIINSFFSPIHCNMCHKFGIDKCQIHSPQIRAAQSQYAKTHGLVNTKPGITIEGECEVVTEKKFLPKIEDE